MSNDWMRLVALCGLALLGCGDDGDRASDDGCESSMANCVGGQRPSLLGAEADTYMEAHEATNGAGSMSESTGYVLETEQGLAIEGSFEASSPTPDSFVFNSGALGSAMTPGFPGVDIQVVIDGHALDTGDGVSLNLDTVQEFGYSSLSGDYFMNAALMSGKDYVLRVTPVAARAGKSYTIEIRGHTVGR